ncbi:MAG: hypothetical protein V7K27_14850 [Nostoc sp.]|uniref:DUF6888 family protein n=1 Tax=Nostoc sp. TaxID=1180 RepID=UPI002FF9D0BE
MKPTPQQLEQLYRLSYILTNQMLKPITLVRMDERDSSLAMLAGDEIDITISKEGKVGYDQTEF